MTISKRASHQPEQLDSFGIANSRPRDTRQSLHGVSRLVGSSQQGFSLVHPFRHIETSQVFE